MKRVLVTGANGHVGFALVKLLVEQGYQVRAGVRDPADEAKTRHLRESNVELCQADLLAPASLAAAAQGMDGVFQVAAVYRLWAQDPQSEIIRPSVEGGVNMLRAAKDAGVKKVVFTSSIAAVGPETTPDRPLTESDWNTRAQHPYPWAKTEAERAAWAFARENQLNLVVINPGTVLGPYFYRYTPSTAILGAIAARMYPAAPPFGTSYVDVRDVARAHLLAYENDKASGRYLAVNGPYVSVADLMRLVHEIAPQIKVNPKPLPRLLLNVGIFLDWLGHVTRGRQRHLTRAIVAEFGNKYVCYSHEKATRELGWEPMDFKTSVRDTLRWMRDVQPKAL